MTFLDVDVPQEQNEIYLTQIQQQAKLVKALKCYCLLRYQKLGNGVDKWNESSMCFQWVMFFVAD